MSSWFNPKTEKRTSPIEGRGLFAQGAIAAGEIVAVKGGSIMDRATFAVVRAEISPAEIQIEDDLYIAPRTAGEVEASMLHLNHSCDPNVGVRGQITFVAMCDVSAGSELTIDYAMIDGDPSERMQCLCGTRQCRKVVTGNDWRLPELRQRYVGYFSRYIEDRFAVHEGAQQAAAPSLSDESCPPGLAAGGSRHVVEHPCSASQASHQPTY